VIFFVPGYDAATESNLAVAERMVSAGVHALMGADATRAALLAVLAREALPLFAMAHGRRDVLLGQKGEGALTGDDMPVLGARPVFAYACHTAGVLGEAAAKAGCAWWGYTGAVTAPESSPELLPVFVQVFSYIRDAFPRAFSADEIRVVLLRIADLCREAEYQVDGLVEKDLGLDVGAAYLCLLHIWQRLRIWMPSLDSPRLHPLAPPPDLFP
jgi:hypothetical protein